MQSFERLYCCFGTPKLEHLWNLSAALISAHQRERQTVQYAFQVLENSVLGALTTLLKVLLVPIQLLSVLAQHVRKAAEH